MALGVVISLTCFGCLHSVGPGFDSGLIGCKTHPSCCCFEFLSIHNFAIFSEDLLLQEDLIELLPMVNEANAMSEELDKKVKYELALISPQGRGLKEGRTEVCLHLA